MTVFCGSPFTDPASVTPIAVSPAITSNRANYKAKSPRFLIVDSWTLKSGSEICLCTCIYIHIIYTVYHSSFPVFAILGLRVVSSRPASDYGKLRFRRRPQTAGPAVWDTTLQRKSSHHVSPIFNIYQTQKWVQFLTTPVTFTTEGKAYEPCCQILLVVLGCLGSTGTMNEKLIEKTGAPKGTSGQHLRAP